MGGGDAARSCKAFERNASVKMPTAKLPFVVDSQLWDSNRVKPLNPVIKALQGGVAESASCVWIGKAYQLPASMPVTSGYHEAEKV